MVCGRRKKLPEYVVAGKLIVLQPMQRMVLLSAGRDVLQLLHQHACVAKTIKLSFDLVSQLGAHLLWYTRGPTKTNG